MTSVKKRATADTARISTGLETMTRMVVGVIEVDAVFIAVARTRNFGATEIDAVRETPGEVDDTIDIVEVGEARSTGGNPQLSLLQGGGVPLNADWTRPPNSQEFAKFEPP